MYTSSKLQVVEDKAKHAFWFSKQINRMPWEYLINIKNNTKGTISVYYFYVVLKFQ